MTSTFIPSNSSTSNENDSVLGNAWFPAVSIKEFEELYRITGVVGDDQRKHFLQSALNLIAIELVTLKTLNPDAEHFTDIDSEAFGENSTVNIFDFKTAVYALAKSISNEQYRNYDSTKSGHDRADAIDETVCQYQRQSHEAVRRLLKKTRIDCELL